MLVGTNIAWNCELPATEPLGTPANGVLVGTGVLAYPDISTIKPGGGAACVAARAATYGAEFA